MKILPLFLILLLVSLPLSPDPAGEELPLVARGKFHVEGKQLFSLQVYLTEDNGLAHKTNRFFDAAGHLILEEHEEFQADPLQLLRFDLKDFRTGRSEVFFTRERDIVIRYRKDTNTGEKEKIKSRYTNLLHGSMIYSYLQSNIGVIEQGRALRFNLLVPKHLKVFGFLLKKVEETKIDGEPCYMIKMYPSSWVLRGFVKTAYFYIQKAPPHQLLRYQGYLTPTDDSGKTLKGMADFTYPLGVQTGPVTN